MSEQEGIKKPNECKYCGGTIRSRGDMCSHCYTKVNTVKEFVRVCEKIKIALGRDDTRSKKI